MCFHHRDRKQHRFDPRFVYYFSSWSIESHIPNKTTNKNLFTCSIIVARVALPFNAYERSIFMNDICEHRIENDISGEESDISGSKMT
mgnify:CR=1 FL=1